jgi:hypothetical protein
LSNGEEPGVSPLFTYGTGSVNKALSSVLVNEFPVNPHSTP